LDKNTQLEKIEEFHKTKNCVKLKHFAVEEHISSSDDNLAFDHFLKFVEKLMKVHQDGRKHLTIKDVNLINGGDARETYRLISNGIVNIDAIIRDPTVEDKEAEKLEEWVCFTSFNTSRDLSHQNMKKKIYQNQKMERI
jgi:hypothetical protein